MSSTRTAKPGSPFRQERFASSPEFDRGLKANLVAERARLLDDPEDRELIWFIQSQSLAPGGLDALAVELLDQNPEAHITRSMREYGFQPGVCWDARQAWRVLTEAGLRQSSSLYISFIEDFDAGKIDYCTPERLLVKSRGQASQDLPSILREICLDPASRLDNERPTYFVGLRDALLTLKAHRLELRRKGAVVTSVGTMIADLCRFAVKKQSMVIVNGTARIGKTHAARQWCEDFPGIARFAQVPSSSDEISFYRAIAESLGTSINLNSKAQELRLRIESVLRTSKLMLCLDDAHYLLPHSNYREALPQRLDWLMSALNGRGVPLLLITTPQFFSHKKRLEEKTFWTGEQFVHRAIYRKLPQELSESDITAVAHFMAPEAEDDVIQALVDNAMDSPNRLASIESTMKIAAYRAEECGRATPDRSDFVRALSEVMPSERAFAKMMATPSSKRGRIAAGALRGDGRGMAEPLPPAADRAQPVTISQPMTHRLGDIVAVD